MWKLVIFALALAAMVFLGYRAMYGRGSVFSGTTPSEPKQQLENVHSAVKSVEDQTDKRLGDIEKKTDSATNE